MRKGIFKKLSVATAVVCIMGILTGCSGSSKEKAAEPQVFTENITGNQDGYDYELWKDNGDTTFNVDGKGGTFSAAERSMTVRLHTRSWEIFP